MEVEVEVEEEETKSEKKTNTFFNLILSIQACYDN